MFNAESPPAFARGWNAGSPTLAPEGYDGNPPGRRMALTKEELDRLNELSAQVQVHRTILEALIFSHPDTAALSRELREQRDMTLAMLLNVETPDWYIASVEAKLDNWLQLFDED